MRRPPPRAHRPRPASSSFSRTTHPKTAPCPTSSSSQLRASSDTMSLSPHVVYAHPAAINSGGYTSYPSPGKVRPPPQFTPELTLRDAKVNLPPPSLSTSLAPPYHPLINRAHREVMSRALFLIPFTASTVPIPVSLCAASISLKHTHQNPALNSIHIVISLTNLPPRQHYGVVDPSIAVPNIHKPSEHWKDALGEQSFHEWKR